MLECQHTGCRGGSNIAPISGVLLEEDALSWGVQRWKGFEQEERRGAGSKGNGAKSQRGMSRPAMSRDKRAEGALSFPDGEFQMRHEGRKGVNGSLTLCCEVEEARPQGLGFVLLALKFPQWL